MKLTLKGSESSVFKYRDECLSVPFMSRSAGFRKRLFFKPRAEARGEALSRASLTKNAKIVLNLRYLKRDLKGKVIESPEELFKRVAKNIAQADAKYDKKNVKKTEKEFLRLMLDLDFLPNSPTLFNAGQPLQQLAGCFVLPVDDDIDSIFNALHQTAVIHKSGGGTGFAFSRLRPRNDLVKSTLGTASGPVSFMKIFDAATEQIKQGGKRRGANMGILRVDHADIEEFITVKSRENALQNFNISVGVTDQFMHAVKNNKSYDLINPRTGKPVRRKNAREIFQLICKESWKTADPGVIFLDTINKHNPTPKLGEIESTNPCGEVPLLPYEACNLGSINLANFLKDAKIDYLRLKETIWKAVHFLDNVIDMSAYPYPEITKMAHDNRKIGLGIMGFADMLLQLGIGYTSEEALKIGEEVMQFINQEAKKASAGLAKIRGVFPNFKGSVYDTGREEDRMRNATRTSVAPTGTISIIAGCSSGIEPLFAIAFSHTIVETKKITEINKYFLAEAKKQNLPKKIVDEVIRKGSLEAVKNIPPDMKNLFITAHQVPAEYHVRMQAVFQKHTDNAVSKTVNLPEKATPKDIEKIYRLAYDLGCKGISIYRYGSKEKQVLTFGKYCPTC